MRGSPPARGAWIEINTWCTFSIMVTSPPARGAWIEIVYIAFQGETTSVAPRTGGVD